MVTFMMNITIDTYLKIKHLLRMENNPKMDKKKVSTSDSLLFIDANLYLDLYRMDSGKKLLSQLVEYKRNIFTTQ